MARQKARARQRRYEHRLRERVHHRRGCLDALGSTTRRLLGLRAGLHGRPLSRGQAASRLGISPRRAARLERAGLRTLSVACGVSVAAAPPRVTRLTRSAPTLQPASFLVPASSAPQLRPAVELAKPRGKHGVKSVTATARPPSEAAGGTPVSVAAALESGGAGPGLALILAICLATLAGLVLVALRRGVAGRQQPEPAAAAPATAAPEPVATYVPPPEAAEPPTAPPSRTRQAATVAATSAVGFLVRELIRRRGGRRR